MVQASWVYYTFFSYGSNYGSKLASQLVVNWFSNVTEDGKINSSHIDFAGVLFHLNMNVILKSFK